MCELTNQRRLGIQEGGTLKRRELKQSVSDRGGCFFMSIKECKIILVVIQNKKIWTWILALTVSFIVCVSVCMPVGTCVSPYEGVHYWFPEKPQCGCAPSPQRLNWDRCIQREEWPSGASAGPEDAVGGPHRSPAARAATGRNKMRERERSMPISSHMEARHTD